MNCSATCSHITSNALLSDGRTDRRRDVIIDVLHEVLQKVLMRNRYISKVFWLLFQRVFFPGFDSFGFKSGNRLGSFVEQQEELRGKAAHLKYNMKKNKDTY